MEGGFFLVCRADFKTTMGNGAGFRCGGIRGRKAIPAAGSRFGVNSLIQRSSLNADTWAWASVGRWAP
jgi:hypothetical protein